MTADPEHSPIHQFRGPGHVVNGRPGIGGSSSAAWLERTFRSGHLSAGGLAFSPVWEVTSCALIVVDAGGTTLRDATVSQPRLGAVASAETVRMPITDLATYPYTTGRYASGYDDFRLSLFSGAPPSRGRSVFRSCRAERLTRPS